MFRVRGALLLASSALLAGCVLDIDETATPDVAVRSFSDVTLPPDAPQTALAADASDAGLLGDVAAAADIPAGGLFAALFATPPTASATSSVTFGGAVPYGRIETVCDAPRAGLGTLIGENAGFQVYDSDARSTQLRAHYVTGFKDGCARQFSAALTLIGDVGTHEVIRYLPSNRSSYNGSDTAYEAVKAAFCRVRHGSPCGTRLDALARTTTFITAYETFGSQPRWAEILLHDGEVKAIDFKTD